MNNIIFDYGNVLVQWHPEKIFAEYFGQSADYVFYDFIEQHKNYPPVEDMLKLISDIDYLKENVAKFGKQAVSD